MDLQKIGKFIAKMRREKNLTQQDLAERSGITDRAVSHWENGRSLPDVSLFKDLCNILGISINELISGEIISNDKIIKKSDEIIINTLVEKKKIKKVSRNIIVGLIIFIVLLVLVLMFGFIDKYPKIDLFNFTLQNSESDYELTQKIKINDRSVFYYGIDFAMFCDNKEKCYQVKDALKHKQISLDEFQEFLEKQVEYKNYEGMIFWDGGTKVYSKSDVQIIYCNASNGNRDVYIGNSEMIDNLNGEYCGHEKNSNESFIRTYKVLKTEIAEDLEFNYVTLEQNNGEVETVMINNTNELVSGHVYEFSFYAFGKFDDTILNIFQYATLLAVKEIDKESYEHINEEIIFNDLSKKDDLNNKPVSIDDYIEGCCEGCMCGDTIELLKKYETAWHLVKTDKNGRYEYNHSFINFHGTGRDKFAFFEGDDNGNTLREVRGEFTINGLNEIILIPSDNKNNKIICKLGEEKELLAIMNCDNNFGTFTLQKQGIIELPSIIKETVSKTKKIKVKNSNIINNKKTITNVKDIGLFLSVIYDSKVWTGMITQPSPTYFIELYDRKDKMIVEIEYNPNHYFVIDINGKSYDLTYIDNNLLKTILD